MFQNHPNTHENEVPINKLLPKLVRKLETGKAERFIVMKLGASVCTNTA